MRGSARDAGFCGPRDRRDDRDTPQATGASAGREASTWRRSALPLRPTRAPLCAPRGYGGGLFFCPRTITRPYYRRIIEMPTDAPQDPKDTGPFEELPRLAYDFIRMVDKNIPHRCRKYGEDREAYDWYCAQRDLVDVWVNAMQAEIDAEEADVEEPTQPSVLKTIKRKK